MLSKKGARAFFVIGTGLCFGAFVLLTIDTFHRIPEQTNQDEMTDAVVRGKHLWEVKNCMGCHTILGEGAYYAPELTRVYERRGRVFIENMLRDPDGFRDPQGLNPGRRRMYQYDFTEQEIDDLVAFLRWIGRMDLNGFPAEPNMAPLAVPATAGAGSMANTLNRPQIFNRLCLSCHSLGGQGGQAGPALDGVGAKYSRDYIESWLRNPQAVKQGAQMPDLGLSENDVMELAGFLATLQPAGSGQDSGDDSQRDQDQQDQDQQDQDQQDGTQKRGTEEEDR